MAGPRRRPGRSADAVDHVARSASSGSGRPATAGLPGTRQSVTHATSPSSSGHRSSTRPTTSSYTGHQLLRCRSAWNRARSSARPTCRRDSVTDDCGLHANGDQLLARCARSTTRTRAGRPAGRVLRRRRRSVTDPVAPPAARSTWTSVTGLKVAVDGTGIRDGGKGCVTHRRRQRDEHLRRRHRDTRVLVGPGARRHVVPRVPSRRTSTSPRREMPDGRQHDQFPMWPCSTSDERRTLPESQAGSAYYWHVAACRARRAAPCSPVLASHRSPAPRRSARRHRPWRSDRPATPTRARSPSPGRTTATPTRPPSWRGEQANQTRQDATGSRSRHRPVVRLAHRQRASSTRPPTRRSTTCTRTAPTTGGSRPSTRANYGLTWSPVQTFTKSSPAVTPSSPVGGVQVPGTTPFRWAAAAVRRVVHGGGLQEQRPVLQRGQPSVLAPRSRRRRTRRRRRSRRPARRTCGGCVATTPPATRARGRARSRSSRRASRRTC